MRALTLSTVISLMLLSCGGAEQGTGSAKRPSSTSASTGPSRSLDIAFYNVENLFDIKDDSRKDDDDFTPDGRKEWSQGRYEQKLQHLSHVIQAMEGDEGYPALIGLAEVENKKVCQELAETISPGTYKVAHKDSPDRRGIDLALLYDPSRVKALDEESIRIQFSQKGYTSRDILYFKGLLDEQEIIHVFLNHWPSRREGQTKTEHRRLDAARALRSKVEEIIEEDPRAQIIILGDFNDYPINKSITKVLRAKAEDSPDSGELINLAYAPHQADKGTYPYKGDWGMLDQAIVSDALLDGHGLDLTEEGLEIFRKDFFLYFDKKYKEYKPNRTYGGPRYYGGYSDHLPILLHLKTKSP